jgi:TRAP-type C4-dicarboxylate transport system substrate-binding protein
MDIRHYYHDEGLGALPLSYLHGELYHGFTAGAADGQENPLY